MQHSILISPSLLSANFGQFAEAARELVDAGADSLHFDIMDGHFVPNLTFGPQLVRDLRPVTDAVFDVHLMVENTQAYVEELSSAGATMLTVHPESTPHIDRLINLVKQHHMKVGVALNPGTPVEMCEWVLGEVDRVLVMTVNPGFGGQPFIPAMVDKARQLAQMRNKLGLSFEIAADGGVSAETAPALISAGVSVLIAGSAIFKDPAGLKAAISSLRASSESQTA